MFDVTAPKVLIPAVLFAVLSPGMLLSLPPGAGLLVQAVFHALVLSLVYWAIAKFVLKISLTTADLFVPALLFVLLTPGLLLTGVRGLIGSERNCWLALRRTPPTVSG